MARNTGDGARAQAPLSNYLTELADRAAATYRRSLEDWMATAGTLREARDACRHGQWLPFLARAGVPERTAQRMLKLAATGWEIRQVADLGGIARALAFAEYWPEIVFLHACFPLWDRAWTEAQSAASFGTPMDWPDMTPDQLCAVLVFLAVKTGSVEDDGAGLTLAMARELRRIVRECRAG